MNITFAIQATASESKERLEVNVNVHVLREVKPMSEL